MEDEGSFTLSFFDEPFRDILTYCGSHSGRDVDKAKETGLIPVFGSGGVYFAEARLVFSCRKLYYHDFDPTHFSRRSHRQNALSPQGLPPDVHRRDKDLPREASVSVRPRPAQGMSLPGPRMPTSQATSTD